MRWTYSSKWQKKRFCHYFLKHAIMHCFLCYKKFKICTWKGMIVSVEQKKYDNILLKKNVILWYIWRNLYKNKGDCNSNLLFPDNVCDQTAWIQRVVIITPAITINSALITIEEFFMIDSLQFIVSLWEKCTSFTSAFLVFSTVGAHVENNSTPLFFKVIVFFNEYLKKTEAGFDDG